MIRGHLELHAKLDTAQAAGGRRTVLARQSFCAPFHLSKPYHDERTGVLMVQVVNPTAGILSGDELRSEIRVGEGASLLITTPGATRVFTMPEGRSDAVSFQRFVIEKGGWLEFLPEPLVPHQHSRFRQFTELEIGEGGGALFADFLMPGRIARGEAWAWDSLLLDLKVRVGACLVLRERLEQSGPELRRLAALSDGGDGVCLGNIVMVSPALAEAAAAGNDWQSRIVRLHNRTAGIWVGLSRLRQEGGWSLRLVAPDGARLRAIVAELRRILAGVLPALATDLRKL